MAKARRKPPARASNDEAKRQAAAAAIALKVYPARDRDAERQKTKVPAKRARGRPAKSQGRAKLDERLAGMLREAVAFLKELQRLTKVDLPARKAFIEALAQRTNRSEKTVEDWFTPKRRRSRIKKQ